MKNVLLIFACASLWVATNAELTGRTQAKQIAQDLFCFHVPIVFGWPMIGPSINDSDIGKFEGIASGAAAGAAVGNLAYDIGFEAGARAGTMAAKETAQ